jgi:membrane fusion protein, multidrug efflux system
VVDGTDRLRDGAKIRRPGTAPRAASGSPVAAAPPDAQPGSQQRRRQANGGSGGAPAAGAGRPAQSNQ